jgi:hypothetical protein
MTDEVLLKAYRAIFVSEQGKIVLDDLMDFCRMFQCNDGMDVYEGRRSVFLHILESMGLVNTYNIATALLNVPPEIEVEKQEVADNAEMAREE